MQYLNPDRPIDRVAFAPIAQGIWHYCQENHKFGFDPAKPVVRLHEPTIGPEEITAALEVLLSTKVTSGPKVKAFEREFCDQFAHESAVAVNSGSSANLLAVAAMCEIDGGLRPGDEVIVSALSWSTTIWPLIQYGLVPVFVDIDPRTLNMAPEQVERAIGRKTRAIMPVHVYGNPCDMNELNSICVNHGLEMIEDCCEALGAFYNNQAVGSFGRVGAFSFYLSHHITTLEGGMVVTTDAELADRLRILRAHGWIREVEDREKYLDNGFDPDFLFVGLGYNVRLTELQAAIGLLQLDRLAGYVNIRRENNAAYAAALSKYEFMRFQQETENGRCSAFNFTVVLDKRGPCDVKKLRQYLATQNIETRPVIAGNMAKQPAMKRYQHRVVGALPNATNMLHNAFAIGNHHHIGAEAREYVVSKIGAALETL